MKPTSAFAAALLLLVPAVAAAHTFWVELHQARPGPTSARIFVGHHLGDAEKVDVGSTARYARFEVRGADQAIALGVPELRLSGHPNAVVPASASLEDPAVLRMLVVDSTRRESTLPAAKFQAYLAEEHLHDVLALRRERKEEQRSGREEYYRCAKAISRGSGAAEWVTQPVGQELELVPEIDPAFAPAGGVVTFRALLKGRPLAGRTVTSSYLLGGVLQQETAVTDETGRVGFKAPKGVPWLLGLVHMTRSQDPLFDWRSVWSTLWIDRAEVAPSR